jgi:hypothetical protein
VLATLGSPSTYTAPDVLRSYGRLSQDIDDSYAQQETALREEMARRGLADSSIQGGRLQDLNVAKRSAREELATQLLDRQAQTGAQDRLAAITAALGYQGQQGSQALERERLAQGGQQFDRSLAEQGRQFDTSTGLDTRRLALEQTLGLGNLGLEGQRVTNQANQFGQSLAEQRRQADRGYGLDERRLSADVDAQAADRALRAELGRGDLALNRDRLTADTSLNQGRLALDTNRLAQDTYSTDAQRSLDAWRAAQGLGLDYNRLAVDQQQGRNQILSSILQSLGLSGLDADTAKSLGSFLATSLASDGGPFGGGSAAGNFSPNLSFDVGAALGSAPGGPSGAWTGIGPRPGLPTGSTPGGPVTSATGTSYFGGTGPYRFNPGETGIDPSTWLPSVRPPDAGSYYGVDPAGRNRYITPGETQRNAAAVAEQMARLGVRPDGTRIPGASRPATVPGPAPTPQTTEQWWALQQAGYVFDPNRSVWVDPSQVPWTPQQAPNAADDREPPWAL